VIVDPPSGKIVGLTLAEVLKVEIRVGNGATGTVWSSIGSVGEAVGLSETGAGNACYLHKDIWSASWK
jgi:hypothetical protein